MFGEHPHSGLASPATAALNRGSEGTDKGCAGPDRGVQIREQCRNRFVASERDLTDPARDFRQGRASKQPCQSPSRIAPWMDGIQSGLARFGRPADDSMEFTR